jgi:intracellular sulfur oxidation DsrE/DsrF family protein
MHSRLDESSNSPVDARSNAEQGASDRREFLGRLTAGAAALAASSMAGAMPLGSPPAAFGGLGSAAHVSRGPWSDAWLQKLTGKHKQFFDAVSTNESFPLAFAANFLNLYHEAYGLDDKDLTAVVGFRHFAMPMALPDELWSKYKVGESLQVKDPSTGAPATRNPFLYANGVALPGSDIPTLAKRGVLFTVCNVALTVLSGNFAKNAGVSKEAAKAEWTEKLLPGMTLVPVGVLAVNMSQEHGCTYCYGG